MEGDDQIIKRNLGDIAVEVYDKVNCPVVVSAATGNYLAGNNSSLVHATDPLPNRSVARTFLCKYVTIKA